MNDSLLNFQWNFYKNNSDISQLLYTMITRTLQTVYPYM